ncbi:DUF262 domain-containing protein [Chloroflexota bacterium]
MSDLVTSVSVEDILSKLRNREWLIPQFQREFVWTTQAVIDFIHSILFSRPIGMATIWTQSDESQLSLAPLRLPERSGKEEITIEFCDTEKNPKKVYALLDGRQRCTAVAMVFGGFHSRDFRYKLSGRYFLDVKEGDPLKQVVFYKEKDVITKGYDKLATCISCGLFPLEYDGSGNGLLSQWMGYIQALKDPKFYSESLIPEKNEIDRRDSILKNAFDGIIKTRLAVYIVPETFNLADVCEIFETLNITGMKVSTVDLVHSWLYADTANEIEQILLREWIYDFGQKEGAVGWSTLQRPELVVQMATASYIALEEKPDPRPVRGSGKKATEEITSVKADDLLRTPTDHWKNVIKNDSLFAEYLGDFQNVVAGGYFKYQDCPYPVSAMIYVALRFHAKSDEQPSHPWKQDDLNAVYRAFFWRNALSTRYDQGFLTQLGTDLKELKKWLILKKEYQSSSQWAVDITKRLDRYIKQVPTKDELVDIITDALPAGALGKTLILPMVASTKKDLVDPGIQIGFPESSGVQMHHIFPKGWCKNNKVGKLASLLDAEQAGRDWVNSVANLMPLSRTSNNIWQMKQPGQVLVEKHIQFEHSKSILKSIYIDKENFDYLLLGATKIQEFWQKRAETIAKDLMGRMQIIL